MKWVEPKIFVLAETRINPIAITNMVDALGAENLWQSDAPTGGEYIIEAAGRLCYKSFEPGMNPNVTKVREGNETYIKNILKSKHGSVLEHASATVGFINVSRIFTHEIVRHRAGTAFSQESLRYVRTDDIPIWFPEIMSSEEIHIKAGTTASRDYTKGEFAKRLCYSLIEYVEREYNTLSRIFSLPDLKDFNTKKLLTSALRRFLPGGMATNIVVTANHRAWRHIIEQRTSVHAEEEIRLVIGWVAKDFKKRYPNLYSDMEEIMLTPEEDPLQLPVYIFENSKV